MICSTLRECILCDHRRLYPNATLGSVLSKSVLNGGGLAVIIFRISQYLYQKKILWRLSGFINRLNQFLTGFECHVKASIGSGFFIPHSQNIVIGEGVFIGNNVTIYNGVTIGAKNRLDNNSVNNTNRYPKINDNVILFTGSKIIGEIVIGQGAVIGANAVVLNNIPEGKTAVGIPARIL